MLEIEFEGISFQAEEGTTLRKALFDQGLSPHNGNANWLNCKGLGSCGTCAVQVVAGNPGPLTFMEKWRLDFPPHKKESGLRLACQIKLSGPLKIKKHSGFWGQQIQP